MMPQRCTSSTASALHHLHTAPPPPLSSLLLLLLLLSSISYDSYYAFGQSIPGGTQTDLTLLIPSSILCANVRSVWDQGGRFHRDLNSSSSYIFIVCSESTQIVVWTGEQSTSYAIAFPSTIDGIPFPSPLKIWLAQHPLTFDLYLSLATCSHLSNVTAPLGAGLVRFRPYRDSLKQIQPNGTAWLPIPTFQARLHIVPMQEEDDNHKCQTILNQSPRSIIFLPSSPILYFTCQSCHAHDAAADAAAVTTSATTATSMSTRSRRRIRPQNGVHVQTSYSFPCALHVLNTETNRTHMIAIPTNMTQDNFLLFVSIDAKELIIQAIQMGIALYQTTNDWNMNATSTTPPPKSSSPPFDDSPGSSVFPPHPSPSSSSSSTTTTTSTYTSATSLPLLNTSTSVCLSFALTILDRSLGMLIQMCDHAIVTPNSTILIIWSISTEHGSVANMTLAHTIPPTIGSRTFLPNLMWSHATQTLYVCAAGGMDTLLAIQNILPQMNSSSMQVTSLINSNLCSASYAVQHDPTDTKSFYIYCDEGFFYTSGSSTTPLALNSLSFGDPSSPIYDHVTDTVFVTYNNPPNALARLKNQVITPLLNVTFTYNLVNNRVLFDESTRSLLLVDCCMQGELLLSRYYIDEDRQEHIVTFPVQNTFYWFGGAFLGSKTNTFYALLNQYPPYSVYTYNETLKQMQNLMIQSVMVTTLVECRDWLVIFDGLSFSMMRIPLANISGGVQELLWTDVTSSCFLPTDIKCDEVIGVAYLICPLAQSALFIRADMTQTPVADVSVYDVPPISIPGISHGHDIIQDCNYADIDTTRHEYYFTCTGIQGAGSSVLCIWHDTSRTFHSTLQIVKFMAPAISGLFVDSYSSQVFVAAAAGFLATLYDQVFILSSGFRCAEGSEWTQGTCQPCAIGWSRGAPLSSIETSFLVPQCSRCANGSIAQSTGTIECTQCQPGRFADRSLGEVCSICISGTYSNQSGSISCSPCDIGEFASSSESSSCSPCPAGQYSNMIGSPSCQVCQPGQYQSSNSSSSCQSCIPGRFANTVGAIECTNTTFGYYTNSYNASVALQCSSGRFSNTTTATFCYECDQGRYTSLFGASSCNLTTFGYFTDLPGQNSPLQCQSGHYSNTTGATTCTPCSPGRYTSLLGAWNCTAATNGSFVTPPGQSAQQQCPPGRFSNTSSSTTCYACMPGQQQPSSGETSCVPCQLGKYSVSNAAECSTCQTDTYTPYLGSASCIDCTENGLSCTNGLVSVDEGWWPYLVNDSSNPGCQVYRATQCPENYCPGAQLQFSSSNTSAPQPPQLLCNEPRLNSPDNWLCAECEPEYIAWGSSCQLCEGINFGIIVAALILAFVVVYILLRMDPAASPLTILVFFLQISALELGSVWSWLDWIRFANFGAHSFTQCIAPLTPSQQLILTLVIPFILICLLTTLCIIHYALSRCFHISSLSPSSLATPEVSPSCLTAFLSFLCRRFLSYPHRFLRWLSSDFNRDRYIGAVTAILIFSYTPITVTVASSLHCVEIAPDRRRLFQTPTIDCDSSQYHHQLLPFVYSWLILYVLGLPIFMFAFIWRRWNHVSKSVMSETTPQQEVSIRSASGGNSQGNSGQNSGGFRTRSGYQRHHSIADAFWTINAQQAEKSWKTEESIEEKEDVSDGEENSALDVSLARTPSLIAFNHRWGHLYRPYRLGAWFWQPIEMLQRFGFALISVLLVGQPSSRYAMYSTLSVISLVSQIWCQPFADLRMNRLGSLSYLLLSFISFTLAGQQPPYTLGVQILFFLLIVPFIGLLLIAGARVLLVDLKKFLEARNNSSTYNSVRESLENSHSVSFHANSVAHPAPVTAMISPSFNSTTYARESKDDYAQPLLVNGPPQ